MTRKGVKSWGPVLQRVIVAVCVASMVASCAILAGWWVHEHHCTAYPGGVRICRDGSYVVEPGF
jgi:hypothetical protein